jgi:hypothetical protein
MAWNLSHRMESLWVVFAVWVFPLVEVILFWLLLEHLPPVYLSL